MSADNWGVCPQCKKITDKKNKQRILNVGKQYGKVSPEEFIKLSAEASQPIKVEETLREDYEIGVDDEGMFTVSYVCSCEVCGFKYEFKKDHSTLTPSAKG